MVTRLMGRLQRLYKEGLSLTEDRNFSESFVENSSTQIVEDMQDTRLPDATGRDVTRKEQCGNQALWLLPSITDLRKDDVCIVVGKSSHPSMTKQHFLPLRSITASATALRTSLLG